jgi:hypothetical protein
MKLENAAGDISDSMSIASSSSARRLVRLGTETCRAAYMVGESLTSWTSCTRQDLASSMAITCGVSHTNEAAQLFLR